MPSRDAARRRAHRRLGGALLLRDEPGAARGARAPAALHVVRRATRSCARSSTSSGGGSAATTACSSTRTSTSTARLPPAAGVGFYGKNTMLITRRFGSWVVLGTLVTDVELEPTPPLDARLRLVHALHRRLPDRRARRAGHARRDALPLVLDAVAPRRSRSSTATQLGDQVYGCDICQDVCPWNRGVEKRRAGDAARRAPSRTSRSSTGSRRRRASSRRATTASSCRATTRAACGGTRSSRSATSGGDPARSPCRYADGDDAMLREHARVGARPARRSARELTEPQRLREIERWIAWVRLAARRLRGRPGRAQRPLPARATSAGPG